MTSSIRPERIALLVVDDDDNSRYTLVRHLQRMGFDDISAARGGREALELIESRAFDLVLLDNMMPELSGQDVLARLRERPAFAEIPVIMVSALTELDSVVACIELGAEDYLPKPINATLLRARVNATLQKKALREASARQAAVIREVFGKYVPESVVEEIVAGHGELQPSMAVATILFADLEAFTGIVEESTPGQVVGMLNEYFPAVIEQISEQGGSVNQFQGDALLATFNVPVRDPGHADHALRAAAGMQRVVSGRTFGGRRLRVRIGIATGEIIAGNVGSGQRVNYTVHGDAVNVAARLEQLNKERGTSVLVCGATVALLGDTHALRPLGQVSVRGRSEEVALYELLTDAVGTCATPGPSPPTRGERR